MPTGVYFRTKKQREIMSKCKIGLKYKPMSEEGKKNIGLSQIGKKKSWVKGRPIGLKHKEESRQKMIEHSAKYWLGKKHPASLKSIIKRSGENHYNYKGGITPINQRIRASLEYKLWSDSVWNKDGNCCQKCGCNFISKLVAHHILNFSKYIELRFAIDNGITFCKTCHKEFHRRYSVKNNNIEQIKEFLCNTI